MRSHEMPDRNKQPTLSIESSRETSLLEQDRLAILTDSQLSDAELDAVDPADLSRVLTNALTTVVTTYTAYRFTQKLSEEDALRKTEEDLIGDRPDTIQAAATRLLIAKKRNTPSQE